MKRYKITRELINAIRNNKRSMREMSREFGFEVKNIVNKNYSIRSDHLDKLLRYFNLSHNLKEVFLNYGKNLGKSAFTEPIKKIRKSKDFAEMIGIMLGDGNLWKNQIKISFDKRNKKHICYVKKLFKKIFGIKLRIKFTFGTNQANLYCYNRYISQKFVDFGLKRGHKIKNNVGVPEWVKSNKTYAKACLRGLIDTDGCIYFSKRDKHFYIKFTNHCIRLLKDFKEITSNLGYSFAKANKYNWCLYRKEEVVKFINEIKPLKSMNGDVG